MDTDPYSLSNLRDIVVPDPPPLWPPAPGVWVALGVVLLAIVLAGWWWRTVRRRNAHRTAGLLLLAEARTAHDVSVTMKRVALSVFPREQVASLYGEDWAAFLHSTCPQQDFAQLAATDAGAEASREIVGLATTWIRNHRLPEATK